MQSFSKKHLSKNHCFLCGQELSEKNRSDEHIFPQWLIKAHKLENEKLRLLNNTLIPYRQLKIPCCKVCNNDSLSQMESDVKKLLSNKFKQPTTTEEIRLFQWCSKILYGLLHKEMMLQNDRKNNRTNPIVSRSFLEELTTFHHFLTSIIQSFIFKNFAPFSIFTVEMDVNENNNFDYYDFITLGKDSDLDVTMVLAIVTNHFGIICVPDNGFQKSTYQNVFDNMNGIPLQPIQFIELACKSAYKHKLLSFTPTYTSFSDNSGKGPVIVTENTISKGEVWNQWVNKDYAELLFVMLKNKGINSFSSPESLYEGDKLSTWLIDNKGNPLNLKKV